jgi:hypothetical protein
MRKTSLIITTFLLALISSCAQTRTSGIKEVLTYTFETDTLLNFGEITRDFSQFENILLNHKLVELEDSIYAYTYLSDTLYCKNTVSKKLRKVHILTGEQKPMNFLLYSKYELALLFANQLILYNLLTNDTIKIIFKLPDQYKEVSEIITAQSLLNHEFSFINGKFYIPVSYKIWTNTTDGLKEFYEYPNCLVVDVKESGIDLFGGWPYCYAEGNYYGDFFYWICEGINDEVLFSFRASDSLFWYKNNSLKGKAKAASDDNNKVISYPVAEIQDFGKIRQYNTEIPRYEQVFYNKVSRQYYRIYKPQVFFQNDSGKIRKASEIPWMILIFDESFNKIGEVHLDPEKFSFYRIYFLQNTLYIITELTDNIKNSSIIYQKVKLGYEK